MPTGYTAELCEGEVPFEKFVLKCARAMGALIEMRDDAMDAPIPEEFKPSNYHQKRLDEELAELEKLEGMTDAEAEAEAEKEYQKAVKEHEESVAQTAAVRSRLVAMRSRVSQWVPPTKDHENFKKFMLEQLDETIKWDGTSHSSKPKKRSGSSWKKDGMKSAKDSIVYQKREHDEEVQRAKERTQWVADLRASLSKS